MLNWVARMRRRDITSPHAGSAISESAFSQPQTAIESHTRERPEIASFLLCGELCVRVPRIC